MSYQDRVNGAEYGESLEPPIPADGLYTIPPDEDLYEDYDLDEQP